jgi:xylulokinase
VPLPKVSQIMAYLLGIDVGTSSAKAVLMRESGDVVAIAAPEYAFATPRPLWAESDPDDWWQATVQAIRELFEVSGVDAGEIAGVGLTGQMHGLVLLDGSGEVLRPCIMWNDQRTAVQCAALTDRVGEAEVLRLTGNPILPGFTAPKIIWVRENEPEVYSRVAHVLLPKDTIRFRLSGEFFTDVSDASGMSLLDVQRRRWSPEMLGACEIPAAWMPEVTESPVASTKVSAEAARLTGLLEGTPIIAGGGDQAAQAVGCGIVKEGILSATLGTSGVVFAHSDEYRVEPDGRLHAFCHAVPGKWHLMGVMLSAAGSFQWFRNNLGGEEMAVAKASGRDAYDLLTASAESVSAGSEGLIFLPYLSGERTPHPDPNARGVFFGLSLRHTRAHMTRAVLEGVTYGLRDTIELMRGLGISTSEVVASGGGARSVFWRQLLADVFESRIVTVNATEGAAFGAAVLAGVGSGVYPDVEQACARVIVETGREDPGAEASVYTDYYPGYRALYPALAEQFAALAEVVERHV